jgi:RNA polymerase sigma factor (sigma-70 family)
VDDAQWIRKAVADFERPLTQYAAGMLRDADLARDVVQETFCRLCRQKRAEIDGRLPEWLYTVCRNRALDILRKERRVKPLSDAMLDTKPAAAAEPSERAEQWDELGSILGAMESLPHNQREVVRLKFQQELSYKQIAAVTGLSIGNVGFLLHTALNTLRQRLNPPAEGGLS